MKGKPALPSVTPVVPRTALRPEELAASLGIGETAAYDLTHREDFPTFRLGRSVLVPVHLLQDWLRAQVDRQHEDPTRDGP